MTFRTFATQLQQQHQDPGSPVQSSATAHSTIDADIAAFLAEGHEPDDVQAEPSSGDGDVADAEPVADGEEPPEDGEPVPDPDSDGDSGDAASKPETVSAEVVALAKAIEAGDPVAFVKALGTNAERLLGSKAHIALRLAVKDVEKLQTSAKADQAQALTLANQLGEKYGDPIAARKAAETGDVDSFVTMVEKWSGGYAWNDIMKWVTGGLAGRKERLEQKARQTSAADTEAQAKQEQKVAEVRAWVDGGVKKLAPELHDPEVVEMVVAEIRAGYSKGITTPAKALPLVRTKLEARYKRLHAVFGKGAPKPKGPSPSTGTPRADGLKTRASSLEEDIAWAKQQARVK